jgi:hypothetical protein
MRFAALRQRQPPRVIVTIETTNTWPIDAGDELPGATGAGCDSAG